MSGCIHHKMSFNRLLSTLKQSQKGSQCHYQQQQQQLEEQTKIISGNRYRCVTMEHSSSSNKRSVSSNLVIQNERNEDSKINDTRTNSSGNKGKERGHFFTGTFYKAFSDDFPSNLVLKKNDCKNIDSQKLFKQLPIKKDHLSDVILGQILGVYYNEENNLMEVSGWIEDGLYTKEELANLKLSVHYKALVDMQGEKVGIVPVEISLTNNPDFDYTEITFIHSKSGTENLGNTNINLDQKQDNLILEPIIGTDTTNNSIIDTIPPTPTTNTMAQPSSGLESQIPSQTPSEAVPTVPQNTPLSTPPTSNSTPTTNTVPASTQQQQQQQQQQEQENPNGSTQTNVSNENGSVGIDDALGFFSEMAASSLSTHQLIAGTPKEEIADVALHGVEMGAALFKQNQQLQRELAAYKSKLEQDSQLAEQEKQRSLQSELASIVGDQAANGKNQQLISDLTSDPKTRENVANLLQILKNNKDITHGQNTPSNFQQPNQRQALRPLPDSELSQIAASAGMDQFQYQQQQQQQQQQQNTLQQQQQQQNQALQQNGSNPLRGSVFHDLKLKAAARSGMQSGGGALIPLQQVTMAHTRGTMDGLTNLGKRQNTDNQQGFDSFGQKSSRLYNQQTASPSTPQPLSFGEEITNLVSEGYAKLVTSSHISGNPGDWDKNYRELTAMNPYGRSAGISNAWSPVPSGVIRY